ncbi:DUF4011 domain-containing anti-phage protein Hhe [Pseudomonas sp. Leaf127]|uniref:DUF4011 domain-containing anti-phage protein Hhe n=1 Tax=Pseudomonas sp. Leaf127 TaxID=1736267 RepID=UPI000A9F5421|nr:DUF4011 domain-containing anti-phage protein Hhe [Pseudomonas sp. Leaf127]
MTAQPTAGRPLTMDERNLLKDLMLAQVPRDGSAVINTTLQQRLAQKAAAYGLEVDDVTYETIRDELIAKGWLYRMGEDGDAVSLTDQPTPDEQEPVTPEPPDDLPEPAFETPGSMEKLRGRLLDLSARNRLLNFSHARSKRFVRLVDELPDQLFTALLDETTLRFAAIPEPTERQLIDQGYLKYDAASGSVSELKKPPSSEAWAMCSGINTEYDLPLPHPDGTDSEDKKHTDNTLQTLYYPGELEARLQTLHAQARLSQEETGANILYLALGFLEWDESIAGKNSPRLAPLMLLPVRLEKGKLNARTATFSYEMHYSGEDILTNLSLQEKLRRDFGLALPGITEDLLPETYFAHVQNTLLETKPDWKLHRYASLGLFEFGKLMMYLDLEPEKNPALLQNALVQRLTGLSGSAATEEDHTAGSGSAGGSFSSEHAIDELPDVHQQFPLIDDADSSQHSALIDVMRGENLVIEGPPGTGKSQTITNMISAALAQGKKILFVAEKRAALEVVKNRLTRAGLGDFCLELHSHKSQKSAVAASIGQRISSQGSYLPPEQLQALIANYERLKQQLNDHVKQLHALHEDSGLSAHQILMQATRLREELGLRPADVHPAQVQGLDRNEINEQAGYFTHLYSKTAAEAGPTGELATHPWFGCTLTQLTGLERTALLQQLQQAIAALVQLDSARTTAAGQLEAAEITSASLSTLEQLAQALAAVPLPKGDEDWALIERLDAARCAALQAWLQAMDKLLEQRQLLARSLAVEAIDSGTTVDTLKQACAHIHRHNDSDSLKLDDLLDLTQATRDLLAGAAPTAQLLQTINRTATGQTLKTDKQGLEHLDLLLDLLRQLPAGVAGLRHKRFEQAAMDSVLPELQHLIADIQRLETQTAETFSLERLPDHTRLEDLQRVLADDSLLAWLKSDWRAAKAEVLGMVRPGVKLAAAREALPDSIAYKRSLQRLNTHALYRDTLEELFKGRDTRVDDLLALRHWYRTLRDRCGRGFGATVWVAQYLLEESSQTLELLQADVGAQQTYLGDVLNHRTRLESALPLDAHALKSADLLGAEGLYAHLVSELGGALNTLLALVKEQQPTTARVLKLAKALEIWQELAHAQQNNLAMRECLGEEQLPRLDQLANARVRLQAWQHTVALASPLMNLSIRPRLLAQLAGGTPRQAEQRVQDWHALSEPLAAALAHARQTLGEFIASAQLDEPEWWGALDRDDLAALRLRLQRAADHEPLLEHWLEYRRLRKRLADLGFEAVIRLVENRTVLAEHTRDACLLGLTDLWSRQILETNPALGQFSGKDQEAIRARFAEIDSQLTRLQRQQVAAQIDRNKVPEGNNSGKVKERTQLALLKHEAGKKTRHEPIRALMLRATEALQALKPCFMMSPMAVAQYLPAGKVHFDIVIMDEASQVRPEEALGAISRGSQLVVVGDPKQLPPTSFFARQGDDDDEENPERSVAQDSESILEAAMPLFRLRRLRWHYRSRHESLIAFSNQAFYDSNLVVYPSPHRESPEFGVKFARVERGRFVEQRNREEAEVVAKAIEHHLLHNPEESLGVVAMNIKQAEQIERALEHLAKQNPALQSARDHNEKGDEPLFIKNLENVQGDERDVIYISATYGPVEAGGTVPQRFGPINGTDGWRRLNVLFTRSKKRMQVFASFTASDVLITGTSSRGVQALRDFLHFAESGRMPHVRETGKAPDSDFEVSVIEALERHGYQCEAQVGVAGFFIDLAVRDPGQPGRYLMGIECDGAAYHSAKSARDRDRLRQSVLEQLGWRIRRIWSVDWFRNARLQLETILQELATLRTEPAAPEAQPTTEEEMIRLVAEEYSQHAERITLKGGSDLREKLVYLDQHIIRPALPDTPEHRRLLRPAMLEALLDSKPADRSDYQQHIPGYLRDGTDPEETRFIDDVLTLISDTA